MDRIFPFSGATERGASASIVATVAVVTVKVAIECSGGTHFRRFREPLAGLTVAKLRGKVLSLEKIADCGPLRFLHDGGAEITTAAELAEALRLATAATAPTDKPGLLRLHVRVPEANPVPSPVGPAPQPAAVPAAATPAPPTRAWPKLSKPLEQLAAHYPVLIIGSGYGGGVSALRLSSAGQKVCVLERGDEKWPGEYPDTPAAAVENMQVRSGLLPGLIPEVGPRNAFFDFRIEEGVLAWIGCGLGGGSLVNSGVCIAPDPRVFELPAWPTGIQQDRDTRLKQGFAKAKAMLQPAAYPDQGTAPLARATRAQEAAAELRKNGYKQVSAGLATVNVSFEEHTNSAGVEQPGCTLCGDCNSGCNVGAKNTVLMNYLPAAANLGAEIFCNLQVEYLEQAGDGWVVHCTTTDPKTVPVQEIQIKTDTLILAAGTLGTTEILLRSRARGLPMSGQVGLHFGTDGDFFSVGYNGEEPMNGIGVGHNAKTAGRVAQAGGECGPCITSVIDCRSSETDVRDGFIIEDMAVPSCFTAAVDLAFAAYDGLAGQETDPAPGAKKAAAVRKTVSLGDDGSWKKEGAMQSTVMWGIMAFDEQAGVMSLEEDQLRIRWPAPADEPDPATMGAYCKDATAMPTMKGSYLPNPLLKTPMKRGTVHPFGGCILANSAATGGCNHKGQVFCDETGTEVYANLYAFDGATIPSSLGVNPLWTISAVAERAVEILIEERGWLSAAAWAPAAATGGSGGVTISHDEGPGVGPGVGSGFGAPFTTPHYTPDTAQRTAW